MTDRAVKQTDAQLAAHLIAWCKDESLPKPPYRDIREAAARLAHGGQGKEHCLTVHDQPAHTADCGSFRIASPGPCDCGYPASGWETNPLVVAIPLDVPRGNIDG